MNNLAIITTLFLVSCSNSDIEIIVTNNSNSAVEIQRIVEIPIEKLGISLNKAKFIIVKDSTGREMTSQITYDNNLLFYATVAPTSNAAYRIEFVDVPKKYEPIVSGRLVPERKDDWAWENDRIAFRVYGPALEATGEISNGIDVWLKRTKELVIDKWYKPGVDYHTDNGEGLDCYKVGRTLGAGALSPLLDGRLNLGSNFTNGKTLDNGPLRYTMRLDYDIQQLQEGTVRENRIISLDAGSNFNKVTVTFTSNTDFEFPAAIGIVTRNEKQKLFNATAKTLTYSEPQNKKNGTTHIGVITPFETTPLIMGKHLTLNFTAKTNSPITYYTGAGWDKWGFETPLKWNEYTTRYKANIELPLKVEIKNL